MTGVLVGPDVAPTTDPLAGAQVDVIEVDRLDGHVAAWDELVLRAPLVTPFLRTWWLDAVSRSDARYVLVLDGPELLGGIALRHRRLPGVAHYSALGSGRLCPDHLDLVARPDRRDDVTAALRQWFQRPGSRIVDLDGLRDDAAVLDALPGARLTAIEAAIWEELPTQAADYHLARSRNFKQRIRKARRRLAAADVTFRQATTTELPDVLDAFVALHEVRPDRRPLLRQMATVRQAIQAGSARGEVSVHIAEQRGRCCAVLISFTTGERLATYQLARSLDHDLRDIGSVLYVEAIEAACAAGLTEVDFLRGEESYKRSFARQARPLWRASAAHGGRARLLLATLQAAILLRGRCGDIVRWLRTTVR